VARWILSPHLDLVNRTMEGQLELTDRCDFVMATGPIGSLFRFGVDAVAGVRVEDYRGFDR